MRGGARDSTTKSVPTGRTEAPKEQKKTGANEEGRKRKKTR